MKPYLKGFHLSLESWRGGRDDDGWKSPQPKKLEDKASVGKSVEPCDYPLGEPASMDELKEDLVTQAMTGGESHGVGPPLGTTKAVPRFREDLEAILELASGEKPMMRCVCSKHMLTAYYGFGDASEAGFGSTRMRPRSVHRRFGL
jgi:hypothetical protein